MLAAAAAVLAGGVALVPVVGSSAAAACWAPWVSSLVYVFGGQASYQG